MFVKETPPHYWLPEEKVWEKCDLLFISCIYLHTGLRDGKVLTQGGPRSQDPAWHLDDLCKEGSVHVVVC